MRAVACRRGLRRFVCCMLAFAVLFALGMTGCVGMLDAYGTELSVSEAEDAVKKAEDALQNAINERDAVAAELEATQKEYNSTILLIENSGKGSEGFFAFRGSTHAVNALNTPGEYGKYTEIGAEDDATSLENMKQAIEWIKKCNKLRKENGLSPLLISDTMMAYAQYQTNASSNQIIHTNVFTAEENLAWGYSDPFDGWYVKQKALVDQGEYQDGEVVNYMRIVNPEFKVTGFACNQKSERYTKTYGQIFAEDSEDAVSAEEYEEAINAYVEIVKEAPKRAEELKAEIAKLEDEFIKAEAKVSEMTQKLEEAIRDLEEASARETNPEEPEDPSEPEMPDVPVDPSEPEIPDVPVDPSEPEIPNVPVDPSEPEVPDVPVNPSEPEMPDVPVNPSEPEVPDVPAEPEVSREPGTLNAPDDGIIAIGGSSNITTAKNRIGETSAENVSSKNNKKANTNTSVALTPNESSDVASSPSMSVAERESQDVVEKSDSNTKKHMVTITPEDDVPTEISDRELFVKIILPAGILIMVTGIGCVYTVVSSKIKK